MECGSASLFLFGERQTGPGRRGEGGRGKGGGGGGGRGKGGGAGGRGGGGGGAGGKGGGGGPLLFGEDEITIMKWSSIPLFLVEGGK